MPRQGVAITQPCPQSLRHAERLCFGEVESLNFVKPMLYNKETSTDKVIVRGRLDTPSLYPYLIFISQSVNSKKTI
jgi:hypothetical protein